MEFSEQALVLKVGRFRGIDAWVRLVSPVRGVYTAFAFGGLKSRRRFLGCLDPLNHVRFKVRRSGHGGYHCLTEARLLDAPMRLRGDQATVLQWLSTLQSPEKFQAVRQLEVEIDTRAREKTPQVVCNLTLARWFKPETGL